VRTQAEQEVKFLTKVLLGEGTVGGWESTTKKVINFLRKSAPQRKS